MAVEGCWKAPKNVNIFRAAVHDIDMNQVAEYQEPCDECRARLPKNRHKGCPRHSGIPHLNRTGDPTTHSTFTNCLKRVKKDKVAYEETGSCQLLPSDYYVYSASVYSVPKVFWICRLGL
jgi:hypothetical protein